MKLIDLPNGQEFYFTDDKEKCRYVKLNNMEDGFCVIADSYIPRFGWATEGKWKVIPVEPYTPHPPEDDIKPYR
jgi:hypothetical protein